MATKSAVKSAAKSKVTSEAATAAGSEAKSGGKTGGGKAEKAGQTGLYRQATEEAERIGKPERKEGAGYVLHEYPSYETYVEVQTAGNKAKLRRQFVKRSHVDRLAAYLRERGVAVTAGICHGTRAGREQRWFRKALACDGIFGTEISETATGFPFTVQWDFHDVNPEWAGRFDFVYSNSWDHAFDPQRAFAAWLGQLRPGGLLMLDYTRGQAPSAANALDPFGAELPALVEMLEGLGRTEGAELLEVLDCRDNAEYRAQVLVMAKR